LIIGTVELLGLVAEKAHLHGAFWDRVAGLDLNIIGYVIVGLFFATWAIALLVWKVARIEEKWTAGLAQPAPAEHPAE
jgi:high-affinity nickel-transport protein